MKTIRKNLPIILIYILLLLPVIIWSTTKPLNLRFGNLSSTLTSLGQIAGLVGLAMFSLVLILSGRLKFLENFFGGLNNVYNTHHLLGKLSFLFLVFHPLILASRFLSISTKDAFLFLLPSKNWDINLGIFSLAILASLLYITIFANIKYDKWKLTHKFMGFAFFLGGLHSFLIPSDISRNVHLRWYMMTLVSFSILTYLYRTVFYSVLVKKSKYVVKNVKKMGEEIVSIEISPENKPILFTPGQYVFVEFEDPNIGKESHPFSIASSPENSNIEIIIKSLGDYTEKLKNLKIETKVKIEGPFGKFWENNSKNQIWIAGGIGITPFLGIAKSFKDIDGKINLFYCVEDEKQAVFLEELSRIEKEKNNFKVIPFYSNKQGFITAGYIKNQIKELEDKEIFFCGPPQMMKSLREQFVKMGINNVKLHSEEFQFR